jgi:hypothetical protein
MDGILVEGVLKTPEDGAAIELHEAALGAHGERPVVSDGVVLVPVHAIALMMEAPAPGASS